jgi:peptidoglycan hydrolase-like protein with peptidoglycan-binding domain
MWSGDENEHPMLLTISAPVGRGQENEPNDVYATDNAMREAGIYSPDYPYDAGPARYLHDPMVEAVENFQQRNGLKVDGYLNPGGPTERAINNRLLSKPRGVGLLYEPLEPISARVGNGMENRRDDVRTIQRSLGALGLMPEDPFDDPHGFIDERTEDALRNFQSRKGLLVDGWAGPGGETERELRDALSGLARSSRSDWFEFANRAAKAKSTVAEKPGAVEEFSHKGRLHTLEYRPHDAANLDVVPTQGRTWGSRTWPPPLPGVNSDPGASEPAEPTFPAPFDEDVFRRSEVLPFIAATEDELRAFKEVPTRRMGENLDWMIIERRGNEKTRAHNELVKDTILEVGNAHRCGGEKPDHTGGSRTRDPKSPNKVQEVPETYLRPRGAPKGQRAGASYADIDVTIKHSGRRLFVNTYDAANRALKATGRETSNAIRLLYNAKRGDILLLIPKLVGAQSLDLDALRTLIGGLLDELCEPPPDGEQHTDKSMLEGLIRFFKDIKP